MASEVGVETAQAELQQYGRVEFPVQLDGKRHGRLRIDRRGISWASGGIEEGALRALLEAVRNHHGGARQEDGALGSPLSPPTPIRASYTSKAAPELLIGALQPARVGVLELHDGRAHDAAPRCQSWHAGLDAPGGERCGGSQEPKRRDALGRGQRAVLGGRSRLHEPTFSTWVSHPSRGASRCAEEGTCASGVRVRQARAKPSRCTSVAAAGWPAAELRVPLRAARRQRVKRRSELVVRPLEAQPASRSTSASS